MSDFPYIGKMLGIELEFFLLDNKGNISNKADILIGKLKNKLIDTEIKEECGHSMLELTSFPHISSREVLGKFFTDYESLIYETENMGHKLFFYGTYPGKNTNVMRTDPRYKSKGIVLGEKEFVHAGRCIGFHFHYSLPTKSYNPAINFFYPDIHQKNKDKILNSFNLYIGLDPAITTLMQSSPYYEGKLLGKDSRMIVYRGDPRYNFKDSLYSKHDEFGTLNSYFPDYNSMIATIRGRFDRWNSLLKEKNLSFKDFTKKELSLLDSSWKPVKLSPHGTIESRGADMNSPTKVVSLTIMLKSLSKFLQNNSIKVMPSQIGNKEPFKIEDDILYLPEMETIKTLEMNSALLGLENKELLKYSKAFVKLVTPMIPEDLDKLSGTFSSMIDDQKTTSDRLIDIVKKKQGYTNYNVVEDDIASEIALKQSKKIYKEILMTKKMLEHQE